ncbi:hypothetical protein SAMN05421774_104182 [Gemmobacter megaterium]|uniref:Uncharacterized protein n=1 Tax=Gemmobacter megaterium TaxID=1086013 RepID=A0A1N7NW32_9RHOB|nr:hypothetical protein [Gemmobacter megaterium]SIT02605.1 hypothetical protein SAMN05421774_104182 [Gemmobacter megaterium]
MMLWRSGPATRLPGWAVAALIGWLWSVPVGLLLWLASTLVGALDTGIALGLMGAALAGVFAPAYSWVGLVIALPVAVLADRRGWFGPVSALVIGAGAGVVAAAFLGGTSAALTAVFGAITLLIVRRALRLAPG